ncbi:hypothetical protein [uncultured Pelagimonas sp.]|uniref:hypothetical protein n=1 Tax=uncultured Pelagimonas sp. TaxID=1618102 RepID=UPI002635044E|nr:hypothetical protein [uncultured Pelagimonas sp.]
MSDEHRADGSLDVMRRLNGSVGERGGGLSRGGARYSGLFDLNLDLEAICSG